MMGQRADAEVAAELKRKGHTVFSWDQLDSTTMPTGVVTQHYKVGDPTSSASPTVFKVWFPPGTYVEAHTHDCDYTEILLEGTQKVGVMWHKAGDIRVGLANRGYGPLLAGPEGCMVLFVFADGRWPALTIGKNDGSTLGSEVIIEHHRQLNETV